MTEDELLQLRESIRAFDEVRSSMWGYLHTPSYHGMGITYVCRHCPREFSTKHEFDRHTCLVWYEGNGSGRRYWWS